MSDWTRHGECNQCGDCCRQATNCVSMLVGIDDQEYGRVRYGEPRMVGRLPMFHVRGPILAPCPKLDGDRCTINETKPEYCRETPCAPEDIEGLPRCSYWFVHKQTGEIKGTPDANCS